LEANPPLNHRCDVSAGVMGDACLEILQRFFREARERKKASRLNGEPAADEPEALL
jgi:tRNA(adenine34) deaminase